MIPSVRHSAKNYAPLQYQPNQKLTNSKRFLCDSRMEKENPHAVALGRKGGKATAERGPDYFRKIAAKRKTFAGGRPKKQR